MAISKRDAKFLADMINHHQDALKMSKAYLSSSPEDARVKRLAEGVISAQTDEINKMRDWLKESPAGDLETAVARKMSGMKM